MPSFLRSQPYVLVSASVISRVLRGQLRVAGTVVALLYPWVPVKPVVPAGRPPPRASHLAVGGVTSTRLQLTWALCVSMFEPALLNVTSPPRASWDVAMTRASQRCGLCCRLAQRCSKINAIVGGSGVLSRQRLAESLCGCLSNTWPSAHTHTHTQHFTSADRPSDAAISK